MPYTPPAGDALIFSWEAENPYTPPTGDALTFSWEPTGTDYPFGDVDQPLTVRLTTFGDVVQPLDVTLVWPFGEVVQPLDVTLVPAWAYWADRVIQPLTVRLTAFGDVVQPLEVTLSAPFGDVAQPLTIRLTSSGDVVQPLTVTLRDPAARTTGWSTRVLLDGVDITQRTTGLITDRAEEGGARVATFTLVPTAGEINPFAWVGAKVVIDDITRSGAASVARRAFTGKVHAPVFNPSNGTVEFTCTDDLQNIVAALPRTAIDAITGGRYDVAVQREQSDNWAYAQAVMQTVAGSLDADVYGALRVTPWHADSVWATYTPANTLDASIDFTLPSRTGLVNKITATFEHRYSRLHRRTAAVRFAGDLQRTVKYGLPLLARATVDAALESSGWEFFYGGSLGASPGGTGAGGATRFTATNGEPVKRDIDYVPYPHSVDLPGGGVWFQNEVETTCLEFSCAMWRRWAQTVTDTYTLTLTAPESIARNGVLAREERASLASNWDAGPWESDPAAAPVLDSGGQSQTLDQSPDATPAQRDAALATLLDVCKVKIAATHRSGRAGAKTWLTPEIDLEKRIRLESPRGVAEGKVVMVEHIRDLRQGTAVTQFEIAISGHGAVGLPTPDETPSTPPAAAAVPALSTAASRALTRLMDLHIGGLADSPDFDENWAGWIVNVPQAFNVTDPGSTAPSINPETQKTERELVNSPYSGATANPLYRADKAYATTGFRVTLPAVEDAARDPVAPVIAASYTVPIPVDDFTLTA